MSVKCESWSVELDVMDEKRTVKCKRKKFAVRIVRILEQDCQKLRKMLSSATKTINSKL